MIDLFNLFHRLDCEIENVLINNDYNVELTNNIKRIYNKYKDEIIEVSKN